jgi:hypothetical protein
VRNNVDVINRSVAIIRPKQPYLDWIRTLPGPYYETLEDLQEQCRAVLIPESSSPEAAMKMLGYSAEKLFEMELEAWTPEKRGWPKDRGFDTFVEWFDVEIHLLVIDSVDAEMCREPYN